MVRSNKYCRQVIFAMSTTICACARSALDMLTTPTIAAAATIHVLNDLCDSDLADICSLRICPQSNRDRIGILAAVVFVVRFWITSPGTGRSAEPISIPGALPGARIVTDIGIGDRRWSK